MRLTFIILSFVLVGAVAINIFSSRMDGVSKNDKQRMNILQPLMGEQSVEKELGATESLSSHAIDILGMSWYDSRELQINGRHFSIYVAFWRPKTVNFFEVAQHVPDQCWIGNGMSLSKKLPYGQVSLASNADPLIGVNARTFEYSGNKINTWFWHAVGDEFVNYDEYSSNRTTGFLASNLPLFFRSEKQVFLRIDSSDSWDYLTADPTSRDILKRVIRKTLLQADNHYE